MQGLELRLTEARKIARLTQNQVAEAMNISPQSVSAWECGNSTPDIDKLPELAAMYHVTTDWLLTGVGQSEDVLEVTANLAERLFSEEHMRTYLSAYCTAKNLHGTRRALDYAREMHAGQFRNRSDGVGTVPYIYHPMLMTCHALALGLEEDDLLSTCLLHDVCEDCGVAPDALPVGEAAREAVRLLTKPKDFDDSAAAERAYYDAISENRIAAMVKLLDRCNNVSGMAAGFSAHRMARYIRETLDYVYPLLDKARKAYPEYANALFLIRYHMRSVVETVRHLLRAGLYPQSFQE